MKNLTFASFVIGVVGLVIALYAVGITLYIIGISNYPTSAQNDPWKWITLPYKHSSLDREKKYNLDEFLIGNEDTPITHLFVLDISRSTGKILKPTWYDEVVKYLLEKRLFTDKKEKLVNLKKDRIDSFDAAKIRLYQLLMESLPTNKNVSFAVLTLGDYGTRIFPVGSLSTIVRQNTIKMNIKKVIELTRDLERNGGDTNFEHLFKDVVLSDYKEKINYEGNTPSFIVTILSDMYHDVESQQKNDGQAYLNELENKIKIFSNKNVKVNLITMPTTYRDDGSSTQITQFFRDYRQDWYRLKEKNIVDKFKNEDFLFPLIYSEKTVPLYYEKTSSDLINNIKISTTHKGKFIRLVPK